MPADPRPTGTGEPSRIVCLTCHPELLPPEIDLDALVRAADDARTQRAADMPDTHDALAALMRAWLRLKELGWREAMYAPTDGTMFLAIEAGSTGVHRCYRDSERRFWIDDGDTWPATPILWRPLTTPTASING